MSRNEIIRNIMDSMSLNRYAYVKGSTVSGVDPLGLASLNVACEGRNVYPEMISSTCILIVVTIKN